MWFFPIGSFPSVRWVPFDASENFHLKERRMSVQRRLAVLNKHFGNHVVGGILPKFPGFGTVLHRGRKSGKQYRTPVKLLRTGDRYVISLPYGPQCDWVRNVMAAGGCDLVTRTGQIHLEAPRVYVDREQKDIPPLLKPLLRRTKTFDFIELRAAG
jgi:deazaflavin-dependent oxidoreductase (nitroreductase family)